MDKNDRKAGLERELAYYKFTKNNRASEVQTELDRLDKKKAKAPETKTPTKAPSARDGADVVERAVVEPTAEKAVINRYTTPATTTASTAVTHYTTTTKKA